MGRTWARSPQSHILPLRISGDSSNPFIKIFTAQPELIQGSKISRNQWMGSGAPRRLWPSIIIIHHFMMLRQLRICCAAWGNRGNKSSQRGSDEASAVCWGLGWAVRPLHCVLSRLSSNESIVRFYRLNPAVQHQTGWTGHWDYKLHELQPSWVRSVTRSPGYSEIIRDLSSLSPGSGGGLAAHWLPTAGITHWGPWMKKQLLKNIFTMKDKSNIWWRGVKKCRDVK